MQKIVVRKDLYDEIMGKTKDIEKPHKYIRRWKMNNGEWRYEYPKEYNKKTHSFKDVVTGIVNKTNEIKGIEPLLTEDEINKEFHRLTELAEKEELRCPALGNSNVYIEQMTLGHAEKTKGLFRTNEAKLHKLQYLSFVEPILKKGVLFMKSRKYNHSWSMDKVPERERTTYGIINKVTYYDKKKNKNITCGIEIVVAWDNERKKFVFSFIDRPIKKSLLENRDFITATFEASQVGACKTEALSTTNSIIIHSLSLSSDKDIKLNYDIEKGFLNNGKPLMMNEKTSKRSEFRTASSSWFKNLGNPRASQFDEIIKSIYGISSRSYTSNIPQSAKKSTVKPDYNGEDMLHKSFDITVAEITEKNKQQKIEQVEKALTAIHRRQPFAIRHIKADSDSTRYDDIILRISSFDKSKIQKAVHKMAFTLDTKIKSAKGEAFTYKAQEELTDRIVGELTEKTKSLYSFLISFLGLPEVRIVSKANLTYEGKILYDPESGKPISKAEWKRFTAELEKFLNRNYSGTGKKIVLSAESLGRILERLSKTNSFEALKKMRLSGLKYGGKTFDWISDDIRNMQNTLGESIDRMTQARIQVAVDSAAQRVTKVTDAIRNDIQQTIIDGIRERQSRAKISQNLFDKCSGLNRDFQRIADTEIQNNTNNAYIKEEVYNTSGNEKVYFKRFEVKDDNTCKKCRAIAGKIALFSDIPLDSERIKDPYADYAIWEGKTDGAMPTGTVHPYCRGGWYRYYPDIK